MLAGQGGETFAGVVSHIYDAGDMADTARDRFAGSLAGTDIAPMLAFFDTASGRRILGLELSAREAMLERFVEVNDLVESNVSGALNSSYAYYRGMIDGGAFEGEMGEGDVLADVWSQEADVRADTEEWVYSFLALAYQPLPDAELSAYTAFSATPAGQDLNRAIFVAFDKMFVDISHALGLVTARYMVGQEL
jgi:hypothetical protein